MPSNMQRLGETLTNRMKKTSAAAVPTTIELGRIGNNQTLITDSLRTAIPKGEYMVNLTLTGESKTGSETDNESIASHSHQLPDSIRTLKVGDRVLVAWCGNEPIIIAIVVSS